MPHRLSRVRGESPVPLLPRIRTLEGGRRTGAERGRADPRLRLVTVGKEDSRIIGVSHVGKTVPFRATHIPETTSIVEDQKTDVTKPIEG
eukprot:273651-Pyramimonas_sp.AAC.1